MRTNKNQSSFISYDLDAIREIPLRSVLEDCGIKVNRAGFFSIRAESAPSAKFYESTNTWFDYGINKGGGVIQLVMELNDCSKKEAITKLGNDYNIPYVGAEAGIDKRKHLSQAQYQLIGIQGDRAGKNITFDFQKYTTEQNIRLSKKLAIPMNELFDRYPKSYEKILQQKAVPYVIQQRHSYLYALHLYDRSSKNSDNQLEVQLNKSCAEDAYKAYQESWSALSKAVAGTEINIEKMKPDFDHDLQQVATGRTPIEIGDYPYSEFKTLPGGNVHLQISENTYNEFQNMINYEDLMVEYPYSAFLQRGGVNVVVKETDKEFFENAFESIDKHIKDKENTAEKAPKPSTEFEL